MSWPAETSYESSPATCARPTPRERRSSSRRAASWATRGTPHSRARWPAEHVHAGLATSYAHMMAPLRRLADRYVLDLLVRPRGRDDRPRPDAVATLARLPDTMEEAESRAGQVERAIVDDLEARLLEHRVGEGVRRRRRRARRPRRAPARSPNRRSARVLPQRPPVRAGDDARRAARRRRPSSAGRSYSLRRELSAGRPAGRWIALSPRRPVPSPDPGSRSRTRRATSNERFTSSDARFAARSATVTRRTFWPTVIEL